MKKLVFITISLFIFACKKNINSNEKLLETIYKTIIETELKKDSTLGILDEAANTTYLGLDGYTSLFGKKDSVFHLKQTSFKDVKLYNSESLRTYVNLHKEKNPTFQEAMPLYKSGNIMILKIPFFNEDKTKAVTEITLANPVTDKFYDRFYVLEKKGNNYIIINKHTLNSSGNIIDENSVTH